MENSQVVLSALLPETIAGRVQAGQDTADSQTAPEEQQRSPVSEEAK
jgi:hypothetical protein